MTTILSEAETAANSSNYDKAITLLEEALNVISNDSDILAKKTIYEKLDEDHLLTSCLIFSISASANILAILGSN